MLKNGQLCRQITSSTRVMSTRLRTTRMKKGIVRTSTLNLHAVHVNIHSLVYIARCWWLTGLSRPSFFYLWHRKFTTCSQIRRHVYCKLYMYSCSTPPMINSSIVIVHGASRTVRSRGGTIMAYFRPATIPSISNIAHSWWGTYGLRSTSHNPINIKYYSSRQNCRPRNSVNSNIRQLMK